MKKGVSESVRAEKKGGGKKDGWLKRREIDCEARDSVSKASFVSNNNR